MAKTSMKLKQQREPKYSTRAYTRCRICGRPHSVLSSRIRARSPASARQAGNLCKEET